MKKNPALPVPLIFLAFRIACLLSTRTTSGLACGRIGAATRAAQGGGGAAENPAGAGRGIHRCTVTPEAAACPFTGAANLPLPAGVAAGLDETITPWAPDRTLPLDPVLGTTTRFAIQTGRFLGFVVSLRNWGAFNQLL